MSEFESNIVDISDDTLDKLFDETPDSTVNADSLLGVKKPASVEDVEDEDEDEEVVVKKSKTKDPKNNDKFKRQNPGLGQPIIEDIDLEDLEEDEDEEPKEKPKKAAKVSKTAETEEDVEEVVEETEEEKKSKSKGKEEVTDEVVGVLKSTVDYLIQSGQWADFEGREDLEITEEVYAKLAAEQDRVRVNSMFSELVDSTGSYGKAIIDFVKSGGNPDEIIDLFKEQKSIEAINVDEVDGQKEMIRTYYEEVLGWKSEKIEKFLTNLALSNELENEAKDTKELFGQYYKKETDRLNSERKEHETKQKEAEQAFESNIRGALKQRKDLTRTEQMKVEDALLNYDQKLPNGQLVNKFYIQFAKLQANPADYIDLVLYSMDKEKFLGKVKVEEKAKAASEAFKFIKGNGAVSSKKGTSYDSIKKVEKTESFDWGIPQRK